MKRMINLFLTFIVIAGFIFIAVPGTGTAEASSEKAAAKKAQKVSNGNYTSVSKTPAGWTKGKKNGWNGGTQPPGFTKGNKKGWNDETTPPGLYDTTSNKGNKNGQSSGAMNANVSGGGNSGGHGRK